MSRRFLGVIVFILLAAAVGLIFYIRGKQNEDSSQAPVLSVAGYNQTKNTDATAGQANPNDIIVFTLNAENQSDKVVSGYTMEVNISDLTGNSTLVDAQGASYNSGNNSLVWTPIDIPANGSIQRQFTVRVNQLPGYASSATLSVTFNNKVEISVARSSVAGTSTGSNKTSPYNAPTTGSSLNISLGLSFLAVVVFLIKKAFWG